MLNELFIKQKIAPILNVVCIPVFSLSFLSLVYVLLCSLVCLYISWFFCVWIWYSFSVCIFSLLKNFCYSCHCSKADIFYKQACCIYVNNAGWTPSNTSRFYFALSFVSVIDIKKERKNKSVFYLFFVWCRYPVQVLCQKNHIQPWCWHLWLPENKLKTTGLKHYID